MDKNIMYNFTAADHRKRLMNIRYVEKSAVSCLKKNMIHDYIPGQCTYQSGNLKNTEQDEKLFEKLRDAGVGVIQTWSECCEPAWEGTEMYRPTDKEATKKFIDLVHKYQMKIIPYTSTNFYNRNDKDFNPAWAYHHIYDLGSEKSHFLAHCSPSSPSWRERILRQYSALLDDFGYDGVYNDTGYLRRRDFVTCHQYYYAEPPVVADDVLAFEENEYSDGAMADMLALIYNETHRRGGIVKLHKEGADTVYTDMKIYDYLWVGEAVTDINFLRNRVKPFTPYLVPDFNYKLPSEHERYLNTIPYMQFPLIRNGNIGIGSPDAAAPDFDKQLEMLKIYKEMTKEGTWCFVEAQTPDIFTHNGKNIVSTYFANLDLYLVIANYDSAPAEIETVDEFIEITTDGEKKIPKKFTLEGRTMKILKKIDNNDYSKAPTDVPKLYLF